MTQRPLRAVFVGATFLAMCISCERGRAARGIVLVTLDTTRADHLGCYGDTSAKTPVLDALARESALFTQAQAAAPTTLASHATMFTGLYPPTHGVRYNGMFKVGPETATIAEILKRAGWATGAIPAAFPVTAATGLNRGFDVYRDLFSEPGADKLPIDAERKADQVVKLGKEWLDTVGTKSFFLWVHLFDPHAPYAPPFPYSADFRDRPYDGEIAFADAQLGVLLAYLKEKKVYDDVLIVVAGDHGEGLYDHNERMHGNLVYQSTIHVPLLIKCAGRTRPRSIDEPVTLADVGPTILAAAGIAPLPGMQGMSLLPAAAGQHLERRDLYFETLAGSLVFGWSPLEGLRRGKWKLISSVDPELYDLDDDAGEKTNVYLGQAELAADLNARLAERIARWTKAAPSSTAVASPLDSQAMARLASLGYVGGVMRDESRGGPSPRTRIHLEGELLQLKDLTGAKQYAEAAALAQRILDFDAGNRYALCEGGLAALLAGDIKTAERLSADIVRRYPEFVPGVQLRGRVYVVRKEFAGAVETFKTGLAASPDDSSLVYSLSLALIASGKPGEASPLVDRALTGQDPPPAFWIVRALVRAIAHDDTGSLQALKEALAHGYRDRQTLESEPMLAPLRQMRGFPDLLRVMATE